ncbi:MAG: phosphopantetheine-binding protein [Chloroflexota bacterium]|nr:phosphopantetheine-binding protein [Chloroflexota bacterium]
MDEKTVRGQLKAFIQNDLLHDPDLDFADDEKLIDGSLLDSMALVQVQLFIEEAFAVVIPDPQMTVATMNTLDQMVARVLRG